MNKFKKVESDTQRVYEDNAVAFDQQRNRKLFEKKWLDFFKSQLRGNRILDVGCGSAEPIAQYFIENGFEVSGIDFSSKMIELAHSRYPKNDWHIGDMRAFSLKQKFDGIIAWNSFFHLDEEGQLKALKCFSEHLHSQGMLMITVGPSRGEVLGKVNGDDVYHSSMNPDEYREVLKSLGFGEFQLIPEDPECLGHTILSARLL